jgi:hypothetical protein
VKLLRVLQERTVRRLGGQKEQPVDVRLVAATNVDPAKAVEQGRLRADLYYRINVIGISVPPLRDRSEDIPLLVQAFITEFNARNGKDVRAASPGSGEASSALSMAGQHSRAAQRGGARRDSQRRRVHRGGAPPRRPLAPRAARRAGRRSQRRDDVEEAERRLIEITLAHTGDNKTKAAEILGFTVKTLHNKLKRFSVRRKRSSGHARKPSGPANGGRHGADRAGDVRVERPAPRAARAMGLEDSRGIGDLLGRLVYERAREAIAAGGDPVAALREDQGIRSILESTAAYGRNVTYAAVVDNDGVAIAHSFPALEGGRWRPGKTSRKCSSENTLAQVRTIYADRSLDVILPLQLGDAPFGAIRVGLVARSDPHRHGQRAPAHAVDHACSCHAPRCSSAAPGRADSEADPRHQQRVDEAGPRREPSPASTSARRGAGRHR